MKTISIRLSDVDAAMLLEVLKQNRINRDAQAYLESHIRKDYSALISKR